MRRQRRNASSGLSLPGWKLGRIAELPGSVAQVVSEKKWRCGGQGRGAR